jgi:hypothetical protein
MGKKMINWDARTIVHMLNDMYDEDRARVQGLMHLCTKNTEKNNMEDSSELDALTLNMHDEDIERAVINGFNDMQDKAWAQGRMYLESCEFCNIVLSADRPLLDCQDEDCKSSKFSCAECTQRCLDCGNAICKDCVAEQNMHRCGNCKYEYVEREIDNRIDMMQASGVSWICRKCGQSAEFSWNSSDYEKEVSEIEIIVTCEKCEVPGPDEAIAMEMFEMEL